MLCMNKLYSYIVVSPHTACDVCQMCRQKILPFTLSSRNTKSPFDLVHFDIWGPFGTASVHGVTPRFPKQHNNIKTIRVQQ